MATGTFRTFMNWVRSPASREYLLSTHFWGPVANWGLPIAAIADLSHSEEKISGTMTPTLALYSMVFMRFAWRVQPRNYLLFACHLANVTAQSVQGVRFLNYWHFGGRDVKLAQQWVDKGKEEDVKLQNLEAQAKSKILSAVDDAKKAVSAK